MHNDNNELGIKEEFKAFNRNWNLRGIFNLFFFLGHIKCEKHEILIKKENSKNVHGFVDKN